MTVDARRHNQVAVRPPSRSPLASASLASAALTRSTLAIASLTRSSLAIALLARSTLAIASLTRSPLAIASLTRSSLAIALLASASLATSCAFDAAPAADDAPDADAEPADVELDAPDLDAQPSDVDFPDVDIPLDVVEGDADQDAGEVCPALCDHALACTSQICDLDMLGGPPEILASCLSQCQESQSVQASADELLNTSCGALNRQICQSGGAIAGECVCDPLPGGTSTGRACETDEDCGAETGRCIADFPQGYCINTGCMSELDCGTGNLCAQTGQMGETACFEACRLDFGSSACRTGYGCWQVGGMRLGVCLPACEANEDCADGLVCVEGSCLNP